MEAQVQNAIEIAWNPSAEQHLKAQAFDYINYLRTEPTAATVCVGLFTKEPRTDDVVRHVALEIVNNAVQVESLDGQSLLQIREGLMDYVRRSYSANEPTRIDSPAIQNKLAQTLTYLFEAMYTSRWQSFFDDLRALTLSESITEAKSCPATLFYLRILASVHDEIADQLIQTTGKKQKLFSELKDEIRVRDASKIAASWQDILQQHDRADPIVVDLCLKTLSRWVSWTDIFLIVNQSVLGHLYRLACELADNSPRLGKGVRDSAIGVISEIIAKKMRPHEKVELMKYISLEQVIQQLLSAPSLENSRGLPDYDTDMAEAIAKLVNNAVSDLVAVLFAPNTDEDTRKQADSMLLAYVPFLLRLFADEYDEVCSTVIPSLSELLTFFRKVTRTDGQLPSPYNDMLKPFLDAIVQKTRYDDSSSWGEEGDQTDEAEFQELRKRLRVLQQYIAAINEKLYQTVLGNMAESTLAILGNQGMHLNWRDLELALYELFLFGELATRNAGLYQKKQPSSEASERLIGLIGDMVKSRVASFPHPAIHLQYMEICVRYCSFFEQHTDLIPTVLEHFIGFVHSEHHKVRYRSWHFFLRFTKHLRVQMGNIVISVVQALGDLLTVKADAYGEAKEDEMSSDQDSQSAEALFNSQLFLFEAVGCISSASSVPVATQVSLARSLIQPLASGIEEFTKKASVDQERLNILQVHHLIMALGTLAHGFADWKPGTPGTPAPEPVAAEFLAASSCVASSLNTLKHHMDIREAARSAFSRMVGVLGFQILQQLPQWLEGLLSENTTRDETVAFLRLLEQVIFGFKKEVFSIFDTLLTPLLQRVYHGFREEVYGTDDEIQLVELKREYLNFLLIILANNLEGILVSETNQGMFEVIIESIEHFARDTQNLPDAKLALSVFTKMTMVWGGADIPNAPANGAAPQPALPGFDQYLLSRFSPISWGAVTHSEFNPRQPQSNKFLQEVSALQQAILLKTGRTYISWLRDVELRKFGLPQDSIERFLQSFTSMDQKQYKNFLVDFLSQAKT